MKRISVDVIKEGMVLEKDVIDGKGIFLLGEGAVLDGDAIELFKTRGVPFITVAADAPSEGVSLEQAEQIRKEAEVEVMQRFLNPPESPMMKALYEAVVNETVLERING